LSETAITLDPSVAAYPRRGQPFSWTAKTEKLLWRGVPMVDVRKVKLGCRDRGHALLIDMEIDLWAGPVESIGRTTMVGCT
jgi:hypothetical protein